MKCEAKEQLAFKSFHGYETTIELLIRPVTYLSNFEQLLKIASISYTYWTIKKLDN